MGFTHLNRNQEGARGFFFFPPSTKLNKSPVSDRHKMQQDFVLVLEREGGKWKGEI